MSLSDRSFSPIKHHLGLFKAPLVHAMATAAAVCLTETTRPDQ